MKAFPVLDYQSGTNEFKYKNTGMDLRDYFAAKVLGGIISNGDSYNINLMAEYSYQLADAMIKQREETK